MTNKTISSRLTVNQLIKWGNALTSMSENVRKKHFGTLWYDSRKISKGDIFIALETERDDGHSYVSTAFQSGAMAAIVAKDKVNMFSPIEKRKCIIVDNPLSAVQKMAAEYRKKLSIPFVAVTGSNGKTTTRHFISSVLESKFIAGKTIGNWNNHIGVPLSILRMTGKERVAVVEFGANHRNEIDPLSRIVSPDIGVITNIGYAHIGNFGSLKNTTEVKFEISSGMNKKKGLLLLNGDDRRLVSKSKDIGIQVRYFGFSKKCHIQPKNYALVSNRHTVFTIDKQKYTLSLFGKHFVYSALPAIFIAREFDIPYDVIADVLYTIKPDSMRGSIETIGGITFIVDCYNANPSSMDHAITLLKDFAVNRKKCAVIGDMLELGKYTKTLHIQLGKRLANAEINKVIIVGEFTEYVLQGALKGGMNHKNIFTCPTAIDAVNIAKREFKKGDIVLLKGSRGVKLEILLEHI